MSGSKYSKDNFKKIINFNFSINDLKNNFSFLDDHLFPKNIYLI